MCWKWSGPSTGKDVTQKTQSKGSQGSLGFDFQWAQFPSTLLGSTRNPNPMYFWRWCFLYPRSDILVPWRVFDVFELTKTMSKPTPVFGDYQMDVSQNSGTPKSSILIGLSVLNHPFWGTVPLFLEIPISLDATVRVCTISPILKALNIPQQIMCWKINPMNVFFWRGTWPGKSLSHSFLF